MLTPFLNNLDNLDLKFKSLDSFILIAWQKTLDQKKEVQSMVPLWFQDSWAWAIWGELVSNTKGKRQKRVPFPHSENRWWKTQEKHRRVQISPFQCTVKTIPKNAAASPWRQDNSCIYSKATTPHWYPPGNREDGRMEASISAFVSCLSPIALGQTPASLTQGESVLTSLLTLQGWRLEKRLTVLGSPSVPLGLQEQRASLDIVNQNDETRLIFTREPDPPR